MQGHNLHIWDKTPGFLSFTLKTHHQAIHSLTFGGKAVLTLMLVGEISTLNESNIHSLGGG